ncbi:hypothetical protein N7501_006742 [Penicillium viridicatum]|nr:hypothetical protein N7501_006742 [Penicillium viridicatum]
MTSIIRPVVAIAGATGHLGKHVTTAFLSPSFQDKFSEIILLSRNESCLFQPSSSQSDVKLTTRRYNESNLEESLQGVQILVNTIGPAGHDFKTKIAAALPQTNIRVYFPSEFGVDHYVHDFAHLEWNEKKKHLVNTQRAVSHMNIKQDLWLLDRPARRCRLDVGRTVASLATLPAEKIPDAVHVGGDSRSIEEIAGIMESAGAGRIDIDCLPYEKYKKDTTAEPSWHPAAYLWFLMGDGGIAHTPAFLGDDNGLVNPGQRLWKWKTVEDLAKETNGQPVKDVVWPRHK